MIKNFEFMSCYKITNESENGIRIVSSSLFIANVEKVSFIGEDENENPYVVVDEIKYYTEENLGVLNSRYQSAVDDLNLMEFAKAAMEGVLSYEKSYENTDIGQIENIAKWSFKLASEMLEEAKRRKG